MKGFSFLRISFETLIMGLMMSACSHDSYESGDGRDSYLRADFVEAHTASAHEISSAVTDEGADRLRRERGVLPGGAGRPGSHPGQSW